MNVDVGTTAPNFKLPIDGDGELDLSSLRGKKVILYFYPKDDTPGCTLESKDFSNLNKIISKKDSESKKDNPVKKVINLLKSTDDSSIQSAIDIVTEQLQSVNIDVANRLLIVLFEQQKYEQLCSMFTQLHIFRVYRNKYIFKQQKCMNYTNFYDKKSSSQKC